MFGETSKTLQDLAAPLCDLDLAPSGTWIGVTEESDDQSLLFGGKVVPLPRPCRFPLVRSIDADTAVVIDSRTDDLEKNGWIISSSGELVARFYAGDAVQDVLVSDKFVVVTYFDESAASGLGVEGNGVAVFDLTGEFLFGYRELFDKDAVDVSDCYAACWAEAGEVLFYSYMGFPLVLFSLYRKTRQLWQTPPEVAGAGAITTVGGTVYFHGPYQDKLGIYEWQIGAAEAKPVDKYPGRLRGLAGGRFIAVGKSGYTIITMSNATEAPTSDVV